jgi:hypothetical protein
MGKNGNRSDYGPEVREQILERMACGESLSVICRTRGMPTRTTVLTWVTTDPAFEALYDRARQAMGDALAEQILEIADDASADLSDPQSVNRAKLKVDTRKWLASKLFPRQFGDVVRNEVSGPAGGPIAVKQIEDSTPSIRLLLQQCLAAQPTVLDAAADEDTTDRFPTADGRLKAESL